MIMYVVHVGVAVGGAVATAAADAVNVKTVKTLMLSSVLQFCVAAVAL